MLRHVANPPAQTPRWTGNCWLICTCTLLELSNLIILLFWLAAELSGSSPPETVWLLTDQSTVEFNSDDVNSLTGFRATYSTTNTSLLSGKTRALTQAEQQQNQTSCTGPNVFLSQTSRSWPAVSKMVSVSGGRIKTMRATGFGPVKPPSLHWQVRAWITLWGTAQVGSTWTLASVWKYWTAHWLISSDLW